MDKLLLITCPMMDAKCDCPYAIYRQLSIEQRNSIYNKLSDKIKQEYYLHHFECKCSRDAELLPEYYGLKIGA